MATELKVPSVGESITEVTIARWVKNDGDQVEMDEVLCELESDKATFELNAETSGTLKTKVEEGETVEIGTVIGEIEEDGKQKTEKEHPAKEEKAAEKDRPEQKEKKDQKEKESTGKEKEDSTGKPEKTGNVVEMKVPSVGESITEVTISSWVKGDGEYVELDEVIAEIESDKATFELTAEASGILHHEVEEGATVGIDTLICKIEETEGKPAEKEETGEGEETKEKKEAAGKKEAEEKEPAEKKEKKEPASYAKGHPSPAAEKLMAEKGIKPDDIEGTGPGGRILKEDVEKAGITGKEEEKKPSAEAPAGTEEKVEEPVKTKGSRQQRRKKMSQLRKTVSKRLVSVKNETAMLTTFNEVNMQPVMELRKKYKEKFKERYDVNLGFMSFFIKASCIALEEWPAVNTMLDGDELIYNDFVDLSIAVSSPKGLVVPVIRNAESMTFADIEKDVIRLATKARENKLSIEEMTGGTFTITNGGIFGSMMSTPIINAPQSAILGMHNIVERPIVEDGEVVIRPMMYLALSYDHRTIDGRESVSFLVRLKELLEDPARLLLEI